MEISHGFVRVAEQVKVVGVGGQCPARPGTGDEADPATELEDIGRNVDAVDRLVVIGVEVAEPSAVGRVEHDDAASAGAPADDEVIVAVAVAVAVGDRPGALRVAVSVDVRVIPVQARVLIGGNVDDVLVGAALGDAQQDVVAVAVGPDGHAVGVQVDRLGHRLRIRLADRRELVVGQRVDVLDRDLVPGHDVPLRANMRAGGPGRIGAVIVDEEGRRNGCLGVRLALEMVLHERLTKVGRGN